MDENLVLEIELLSQMVPFHNIAGHICAYLLKTDARVPMLLETRMNLDHKIIYGWTLWITHSGCDENEDDADWNSAHIGGWYMQRR